jgi:hypothetical protein
VQPSMTADHMQEKYQNLHESSDGYLSLQRLCLEGLKLPGLRHCCVDHETAI